MSNRVKREESADSKTESSRPPSGMLDFQETLQARSCSKYLQIHRRNFRCQSKDLADFLNLQGKLESMTLNFPKRTVNLT